MGFSSQSSNKIFSGCSYSKTTAIGNTTIVTAEQNVNGILIIRAKLYSAGEDGYTELIFGSKVISFVKGYFYGATTIFCDTDVIENVYLPAGEDLKVVIAAIGERVDVLYKVL